MSLKALQFPSTQTMISTAASVVASAVLLRSLAREYLPRDFQYYVYFKLRRLFAAFSPQFVLVVDEFEGLTYNHLFKALEVYLRPQIAPNTKRFRVTMPRKESKILVVMERNEEIVENFKGVQFRWKMISKEIPTKYIQIPESDNYHSTVKSELRYYELCFNKKYKDMVFAEYLPYVMEKAKEVMLTAIYSIPLFCLNLCVYKDIKTHVF